MSGPPKLLKLKMRVLAAHSVTRLVSEILRYTSKLVAHIFLGKSSGYVLETA